MIQGLKVVDEFFPFELGSADMVLGVTWLRRLGDVRADWSRFIMKFKAGNMWVSWMGDPSLCYTQVSLRLMARSLGPHQVGILLEVCEVVGNDNEGVAEAIPKEQ